MKRIKEEQIQDILDNNEIVVIKFGATWCSPCKMMSPELDKVEKELGITIYDIDIDECPNAIQTYDIMGVPTILKFVNGELIKRTAGYQIKSNIIDFITKI